MKKQIRKSAKLAACLSYLTGGLLCVFILLLVFAVKGYAPFGDQSVAIMDMCHGYIPVYYHLYDFLHGDKSLFFDWYSGTGVNMVGVTAVNGLLSPLNLLFYLVPRDGIAQFMNIFLLIKVFLMAVSAQFFFKRRFGNLPDTYACVFAVLYALSGYVLLYYMHIIWLDVLIVFPLLLYFGERMLRGGKMLPYLLCVFLTLLSSFYLGVMAIICVFFIGGAYVFLILEKKDRPSAAMKLGVGTLAGALLPMFLLLPGYLQMSASSRYGYTGALADILTAKPELNTYKILMFGGLQLAFLLTVIFILNYKKHPNQSLFALVAMLILYLPWAIEGSAALWHFGSYKDFPYRFGFAAVFFALVFAAAYISEHGDSLRRPETAERASDAVPAAVGVVALLLANGYFYLVCSYTPDGSTLKPLAVLLPAAILFGVGLLTFAAVLRQKNAQIRRTVAFALCIVQILPPAFVSIGSGSVLRYERREHDVAYVEPALAVSARSQIDNAQLERIHDPDMTLNINYGFVMGKGALSNWTHQIPAELQQSRRALGYSTTYTLLLDGGGTVFSDALLHMTETVSKEPQNSRLYTEIGRAGDEILYANNFTLPNVMLADSADMDFDTAVYYDSAKIFENQNKIYNALGGAGTLIRVGDTAPARDGDRLRYTFTAGAREALYFTSLSSAWSSLRIYVNDELLSVPSYHRETHADYTAEYNNNCLLLGVFDNETVQVEIKLLSDGADMNNFAFGFLSLDKMNALNARQRGFGGSLTAGKRSVSARIENADRAGYAILPVSYDAGWTATVNGEAVAVEQAAGDLCAVRVSAGQSQITLKFTPTGLKYGGWLTLAGLLLTAVIAILEIRKKNMPTAPVPERLALYTLLLLWLGALAAVYVMPLLYSFIQIFK
ncbi:MAG: YfhO family protein [Clostridia bacterium]|nr:YfhO family protein [Clostridia bacterium]